MTCAHTFSEWVEVDPRQQWRLVTYRLWWRECSLCKHFEHKSSKTKESPDRCPTLTQDDVEALP